MLDAHARVRAASPLAAAMFALDPAGRELAELIPGLQRFWAAIDGLEAGAAVPLIPLAGRRANGVPFALDLRVRMLADGGMLCALRELDRNARARSTPPSTRCRSAWRCSTPTASTCASTRALCDLLGRGADELLGIRDQELTHPDDRQSDLDAAGGSSRRAQLLAVREALRAPGRLDRLDARQPDLPARRDQRPLCWVGQFQDITELRRMASRDPLTDAINRRAFDIELDARATRRCSSSTSTASRTSTTPTAITLATSCCARPRTLSAGGCGATTCSRGSAATSSPCCCRTATPPRRCLLGNDLAALVAGQRFVFDGIERSVTASVGVTAVTASRDALSAADRAMYDAKAVGGNRVRRAR